MKPRSYPYLISICTWHDGFIDLPIPYICLCIYSRMLVYVCIYSQDTTLQDDSHRPDIYRAEFKEDLCGKLGMVISGGSSSTDVELSQIDLFILAAHVTPGPLYHPVDGPKSQW